MRALLDVLMMVLNIAWIIVIVQAVLSWLVAFNVVNTSNQFVSTIWRALHQLTEPLLRPIRNFLPRNSTMDFSPLVLLLVIFFLQRVIVYYVYPAVV